MPTTFKWWTPTHEIEEAERRRCRWEWAAQLRARGYQARASPRENCITVKLGFDLTLSIYLGVKYVSGWVYRGGYSAYKSPVCSARRTLNSLGQLAYFINQMDLKANEDRHEFLRESNCRLM